MRQCSANWIVPATSTAVSNFIQSIRSSGKRRSKLFINALNETCGNPRQADEELKMSLLDLEMATAIFSWMKSSHRDHREHREVINSIIAPSVPSVCSVANRLHTFENRYIKRLGIR